MYDRTPGLLNVLYIGLGVTCSLFTCVAYSSKNLFELHESGTTLTPLIGRGRASGSRAYDFFDNSLNY